MWNISRLSSCASFVLITWMTSVVHGRWSNYVDMLAHDASSYLVSKPAAVLLMHKARRQRREINIKSTIRGHMPDLMAPPHYTWYATLCPSWRSWQKPPEIQVEAPHNTAVTLNCARDPHRPPFFESNYTPRPRYKTAGLSTAI